MAIWRAQCPSNIYRYIPSTIAYEAIDISMRIRSRTREKNDSLSIYFSVYDFSIVKPRERMIFARYCKHGINSMKIALEPASVRHYHVLIVMKRLIMTTVIMEKSYKFIAIAMNWDTHVLCQCVCIVQCVLILHHLVGLQKRLPLSANFHLRCSR